VGTGLERFDSGRSVLAVHELVIGAMGSPTNRAFVNTVYQNLVSIAHSRRKAIAVERGLPPIVAGKPARAWGKCDNASPVAGTTASRLEYSVGRSRLPGCDQHVGPAMICFQMTLG